MEELRMELRSLLLSSKHGIPTHEIESHYEDIIGKRLDYRKFNFQSVSDLMHAMPDVARLDSTGEVYHALSDESTAHIKKMVMRQKTKPIKVGRGRGGRGRGRGRGGRGRGHFRGGYMSARGAGHFTTRGTGHTYYRGTGHMLARGTSHMSARAAGHFSARGNGPEPARGPGFGGNQSYGFSGDLKQHSQNDKIPFGHNSLKGTVVTLRSTYSPTYSESNRLEETENVPIIPQRSPMKNLQINISPGGSRVIMADKPDPKPSDLREYLKEKKIKLEQNNKNDNCQNYLQFQYSQYKKELPPRFMKANADRSQGNNADKVLVFQKTSSVVHDIKTKNASQGYIEEKAVVHTIESQNWEVPEKGEEYLLAFKDYFASRGEEPPPIEIVEGKVSKQNGFYGRLRYNGLMYYPLVILHTRQHAEWMAAKAFCTQNNITLPVPSVEPQSPDKQVHHSEIQPSKSVVLSPVIVQSHSDHIQFNSPQPSNPVIQTPVSSLTEQENMDIVHKLYMMLKDKEFGVFLKYLPSLYVENYNEELTVDLKSFLLNFPDFFSVEEPLPNRFIVYTVPDALNKPKACSASTEVMRMDYPRVPPCHLPKVGDVVKGTIVFVYSPDEFYFRDINTEDTMQALEEMLNTIYSKADVPDVKSLAVNSFVIGQYLEGWYRAQVKKIDEKVIVVSYIDYGNSEEVTLEDLRCLPTEDLIVNTPALAIKCALRKHQDAVGWVTDAEQQLQSLQDSSVTMTVISLTDDVCNCDLYPTSGFCINENITIMPTVQKSPSPPSDMVASSPSSTHPAPVSPASKTEEALLPPSTTISTPAVQQEALLPPSTTISTPAVQQSPACSVVSSSSLSSSVSKSKGKVHFTPDPNSLAIPEKDAEIAIYICDVLSECCVILRFVDDNFSDKLDELENEIADQFDSWPVPAEVKLSNVYAAAVDTDPDEFEEEEEEDVECEECKRYHRVRVIRKEKDQYYCFFPDHGDFMTLEKSDLREIDSKLNTSLPYQAVVASLEGLDSLPSELKDFAKRCLQKLLFLDDSHSFVAVVTDKLIMESRREDTNLLRVRKIISCLDKVELDKVKQIYKDIYKEPCEDVEELLQELPGFGSWKEHLHINIYNTEQDDEDVLINEVILDAINDVEEGEDALDVFNTLFGTSYKSFEEMDEEENEEEEEEEEADKVNSDALQHEEKEEPVISSPLGRPQSGTLPVKRLYTWNSEAYKIAQEKVTVKQTVYKFWTYPLMTSSAIIIISVESPSHFVGIPAEPALEFEKMLVEVNQALSESSVRPDRLEENHLYAVKMEDGFHRALFRQRIGQQGCKTYLPDTCQHEVVPSDQLFILPERFAAMPFLANRMSLGGVKPIGPTWSQEAKEWFYKQTYKKVLYALVVREEHIHNDLPPVLVVHLIDTSSEEDILLDDQMVEKLMAVKTS
ncbi:uncharacterized protein LOC106068044 isoform X3 [Biomphalaria glabrata]|uniref:Uncharacterized protein LOC106068044 isoform X3 n=1 Tax=Biomphalaria glabrata TaxID=6526 RepID=A0A9W2Z8N1_BIOGL|nr:uncharacterized protein LOC106068044 isoform X3 [Biomphalaria glabrata]